MIHQIDDIHRHLDRIAKHTATTVRHPVPFEPNLWDALASDRDRYPWGVANRCPSCGERTRPSGADPIDWPDTLAEARQDGTCRPCRDAQTSGIKRPPVTPGEPCGNCQRAMRPGKRTLADYPGTVKHQSRGLCKVCYRKLVNPKG